MSATKAQTPRSAGPDLSGPRTDEAEAAARFFQGLADPTRIRILRYLLDGPRTAGEIVAHVGRHQPSVSSHLGCLRFCGFVEAWREGRTVHYALIDPGVRRILDLGERHLAENVDRILACRLIAPSKDGSSRPTTPQVRAHLA